MNSRIIKKIAVFLILCTLNTIIPMPAFAADVQDVIEKLVPKNKKQQIQNLIPQVESNFDEISRSFSKTNKIEAKDKSGAGNKNFESEKQSEAPQAEQVEEITADESQKEIMKGSQSETPAKDIQPVQTLSKIEKGFLSQVSDGGEGGLAQFGYDIFQNAVGNQFSLIPSIPIGPDYKINAGDKLVVTIWGNVNETFSLTVDDRGAVTIPKIGVILVSGYSLDEAKDIIYKRFSKIFVVDFNVDITIKEIGSIKVYFVGEFVKPGAYTVLGNTSLYDAVFIGGGPTKNGTLRNIELVRKGERVKTLDLYDFILTGKKTGDILLKSGDVIKITPVGKIVGINGNVRRPAIYELKDKTELSQFISLAGGITPTSYLQRIQIKRKEKNKEVTVIDVNYKDYLNKYGNKIFVEDLDFISITAIEETIRNVVYLNGNVIRPGRYELRKGMRLLDLIVKAEGLAPDTYMERAQIFRLLPPDMRATVISIDLNRMKAGDPENNPTIKEFDKIRIYAKSEMEGKPNVYVSGEINDGDSSFPLTDNMRISDLIYLAGGLKESAYLDKAELVRSLDDGGARFYFIDLNKVLKAKDKNHDILLKKNDFLFIRRIPDYGLNETVSILGNVKYPGKYAIYKGERLSSVIARAGGFTEKAFLYGSLFVRDSIRRTQNETIGKLRREVETKRNWELARIPYGLTTEEVEFKEKQINKIYDFSFRNLGIETPGRIIIDLFSLKPGNDLDIILQNGDTLTIPDNKNNVTVFGEVYFPGSIIYEKGKSFDYYLTNCGGLTDFANSDKMLVLRANGKVEKKSWTTSIFPGDSIFVTTKPMEIVQYQKPFDWGAFWESAAKAGTTITTSVTSIATLYILLKNINK